MLIGIKIKFSYPHECNIINKVFLKNFYDLSIKLGLDNFFCVSKLIR